MTARERITEQMEECLGAGGFFLVEIRVHPGKAVVFIDHPSGVKLEDCIRVARCLEQRPGLEDVFQQHALEVSSPGLDEPLKVLPQYRKREGQRVSVLTADGMKREGVLREVTEEGIGLEMTTVRKNGKQREAVTTVLRFPYAQIKETRVNYSIQQLLK
jgi:ribosome maturation factor RimP